ncbi:LTA synthase family protein [Rapidithrix thailandica]|uniref:LTA synthase family protein n=1 Tax=Rapidithrix thailandica TaxID=413964 RepID=A0AAW9S2B0_9BACT
MRQRIKAFFTYALFWYGFFMLSRLGFMAYQWQFSKELNLEEWLLSCLHGSRLDFSMVGYFLLLPGLLLLLTSYTGGKWPARIISVYTCLLIPIISLLTIVDMELYSAWGFRLDTTPLKYEPEAWVGPSDTWTTIKLLLIGAALIGGSLWVYFQKVRPVFQAIKTDNWKSSLAFLLLTAAMILPIRGSLGMNPINSGFVYYHPNKLFANHAAVNMAWNLMYALTHMNKLSLPKDYFDQEKSQELFGQIYQEKGKTVKLLKNQRPNIIFIGLESFTARLIEVLGGEKGITPTLNQLAKEGVLFDNFYSNADRTEKGIVASLSSYPSHPTSAVIKYPTKTLHLPFLNKDLKKAGYNTALVFGHNMNYVNFRSYFKNAGFDVMVDMEDFDPSTYNSEWGVDDHYAFERLSEEIENLQEPFFTATWTVSSHEPFKVPMETVIEGSDVTSKFLNSAYYTDKSLGEFIERCKKQPWWDNTLVVITADHSVAFAIPGTFNSTDKGRFRIPLIMAGGALAVHDTLIHTYASQNDIASTILGQLDLPHEHYKFGRNVLTDQPNSYAFYTFINGFGILSDSFHIVYDNVGKQYIKKEGKVSQKAMDTGKAHLQMLFTDMDDLDKPSLHAEHQPEK